MNRDSYSNQQAHASFQPRSPQSAIDRSQLGQPTQHSSSTNNVGTNWLNKASSWVADKFQTAQNVVAGSGDAIAPDQILPALKGTASPNQPLVGVIDSGFGANEHGSNMVEAIEKENPQAQIWQGDGVGTGNWSESLVEFVDTAKAGGHSRAVANLSFDLTEVHPDGSTSTRTQLTAEEQSALTYARDNDVLVVASSGNQGGAMSALGQASQPSDNLIVVGAANGSDRAAYSSYGNGLDLVADVGTAGTSSAAANVTGTIAQLWSANPELSSQQVNQILTASATDLKTLGRDAETGAGLLNSTGAIELATHTVPESIVFSGAQLVPQDSGLDQAASFGSRVWTSTDGAIASERPNWSWSDVSHAALDVAGFVPVVGTVADVANGALYLAEGKKTEAALSFAAAVPVVGDAIAVGAKAVKAAKAVNTGVQAARATTTVARGAKAARSVAASTTRSATREVGTVRGAVNRGAGNVERVSGTTRGSTSGGGSLRGNRSTGRASNPQPPRGNSGGGGNKPPTPSRSGQPNSPRRLELEAPPRRLAIEGRTTARPLHDRGARPGPGQRSLTQEQWKKLRGDQRANQNVQRIPGHGHERHGSQVTTQQLIDRVQHGSLPNGTTRTAPNRASRFDSARRELEAVGRARAQLRAGRPMYKVNSKGEVEVDRTLIVPGSRGGYGSGVEVRREAAAAARGTRQIRVNTKGEAKVKGKENSGSQPPLLPGRPVRPTAQDSHAHVRFEYDSRAGRWKENTHFPAPPNRAE